MLSNWILIAIIAALGLVVTRLVMAMGRQKGQFAAILDATHESIFLCDRTGTMLAINTTAAARFGKKPEEMIGKCAFDFFPEPVASQRRAHMNEVFATGQPKYTEDSRGQFYFTLNYYPVRDERDHVDSVVVLAIDISARRAAEEAIRDLAFYDPLTRLPNRRLLLDRLKLMLASSARSGRQGAMLFIDLDNFKTLNDSMGHDVGDQLLKQVAQRFLGCVREGDTVARLGGDEFVVLLDDLNGHNSEALAHAQAVGEKILAVLAQPFVLPGREYQGGASVGVTLFCGHGESVDELLKQADLAMYQAKEAGRNTLRFFDRSMQAAVADRVTLESDLRTGLREGQFLLYYQAQVDGQGQLSGAEALVRWQHPVRGMVNPGDFIALAEETGLILPLGHWVLRTACQQLVAWGAQPQYQNLSLAVNISVRQFRQAGFVDEVLGVLRETGANPARLKLEMTESLLMDNVDDVVAKMWALKETGITFSLDDFGTGYSSLSYLRRLPLDQLKIDQSFVRDVLQDSNDAVIARAIVALAQSLGLAVIAEGVETDAQRGFLSANGCHCYQGYFFGRPGPVAELAHLLDSNLPARPLQ